MHLPKQANPPERRGRLGLLSIVALVLTLALMIGRATIHENVRDVELVAPGQVSPPRDAGPTTSLLIDLALAVPALLLLIRGSFDRELPLSFHASHGLVLAVAALAWASVFWSSDRFNAAVNASHLLAAGALFWAASQLFRDGLSLRLLAAACVSLLLIFTAHGAIYRLVDVPENLRYWQEHRTEELARRGWQADSFEASQFEKKLASGEMIGFSTSPNTFAATLVMVAVVTFGVIAQRLADGDEIGWPIVLALPVLPAAWILTLTQSKAAITAPFLALVALALAAFFSARLKGHARFLYLIGISLAVALAAVVIGYGLERGRLPSASLAFRWNYWIGAWRIFTKHPWLGVGWTSFAAHYLHVRLPVAAEEVKDPHNFIVRAFVELGLAGGVLALGSIARFAWEVINPAPQLSPTLTADRRITAWLISAITSAAFLIGLSELVDTGSSANASFILLQVLQRLLYFGLMLLAFAAVTLRSSTQPMLDPRPARWIAWALAVAAIVFLIQNLVDFSLFEPGTMTVFAVIAGASIARFDRQRSMSPPIVRVATMGTAVAVALALCAIWIPVTVAENRAAAADEAIQANDPYSAAETLQAAFDNLWISNSDYAFRAAYAFEQGRAAPAQVLPALQKAISADPLDPQLYRNRARYLLQQPNPDGRQIVDDFESATRLDPNEVALHLEFAEALSTLGQSVRSREELREALRYNNLLNPDEPKRLNTQRVGEIEQRISALAR